jgi:PAS domain S-box-containing protein
LATPEKNEDKLKLLVRAIVTLIDLNPDGIVIGDLNGHIIEVNEGIVKMLEGPKKEELLGKHVLDFVDSSDRDRATQDSLDSLFSGQGRTEKYHIALKTKKTILVEVMFDFIRDENNRKIGFIDIVKNLSNSKKS